MINLSFSDPYNWTVTIEARTVGSEAAEVWWRGIPSPAERWVRVYRGAHACGSKREQDEFRLATRDLPPAITLTGLQPNTKYVNLNPLYLLSHIPTDNRYIIFFPLWLMGTSECQIIYFNQF